MGVCASVSVFVSCLRFAISAYPPPVPAVVSEVPGMGMEQTDRKIKQPVNNGRPKQKQTPSLQVRPLLQTLRV